MAQQKLERLMNVIAYLSDTDIPVTLREIISTVPGYPENYDTARRAFERDKETLRSMNFDIQVIEVPNGDKGYKIIEDTTYFDIELSPSQRSILEYALSLYGPDKELAKNAVTKLGGSNPENEIDQITSLPLPDNFEELYKRCLNKEPIAIFFKGSWRNIVPERLIARDGYWYCESKDLDKSASRTFRIDRIEEIKDVTSDSIPEGMQDDIVEEGINIILKCHPRLLEQVTREFNGTADKNENTVSLVVTRTEMLITRIYDYAGFVSIIEPAYLKAELLESQKTLLATLKGQS